jgi:hypothetical protein
VKLVSEVNGGVMAGGGYQESWQLTSAPYAARWHGTFGGGPESDDDGTTEYVYDGQTIHTRPSSATLQLDNPLATVKKALDSGRARMVGEATIEGASVYEISLPNKSATSTRRRTGRCSSTARPVGPARCEASSGGCASSRWSTCARPGRTFDC